MKIQKLLFFAFGLLVLTSLALGSFPVETALSSSTNPRGPDSIIGYDAYNGYKCSNSMSTLNAPTEGWAHIYYRTDQYDGYKIPVSSGDEVSIRFEWFGSRSAIDLYFYNTGGDRELLTYNKFDFTYTMTADSNGYLYFAVDSDRTYDRGDYYLTVTKEGGAPPDTIPPSVSITNPSNGATVSGTVSISFTASDENGIASRAIKVDGVTKSTGTSYSWDTTTYSNGVHTIRCEATDPSSNTGFDEISVTVNNVDTIAPTCTITFPTEGATVSGTITVTATASDNVGVDYVDCGGSLDYTAPYEWSIDTTAYDDGAYTVTCTAYDVAGNSGADTNGFNIDNSGGGGNELTSGQTVYSSLAAQYDTEMWTIQVGTGMESMNSVLNCGSSDFDLYGRLGTEPTTSTYDWRGYTTGGEDVTFDFPGAGTWYIMVRSYSGTGAYDLTVTLDAGTPPEPWGTGGKYAIIVGISDYGYISDLSYCDEDATDWYNFLNGQGYECRVYGDGHTSDYPRYDGKATESVVRAAVQGLAAHAQPGDKVFFVTSGHGSGDGSGSSFLCMWDCSGSAGCYYDTELAADIGQFDDSVGIFVFVDHCYSGGMGPELMALSNTIYCTTTCTEDGYGWDDGSHQNGAWTYEYLERYWVGNPGWSAEYVFDQASTSYPHTGGDAAMEFDGYPGSFYV